MARKEICMEELVEVLSQWHNGRNIKQIKRSLGFDRKTIRPMARMRSIWSWPKGRDSHGTCRCSRMSIISNCQANC